MSNPSGGSVSIVSNPLEQIFSTTETRRVYPQCCKEEYCPRKDCGACPNRHYLEEFHKWVEEHDAVPVDPIWCPNVWIAREGRKQ